MYNQKISLSKKNKNKNTHTKKKIHVNTEGNLANLPLCCIGERKALWKASLVNGDKYPLNQQDFDLNSDEKSPEVSFMLVPVLKVLLQEVKA